MSDPKIFDSSYMVYSTHLERLMGRMSQDSDLGEFAWLEEETLKHEFDYSEWFLALVARHRGDTTRELKEDMPDVAQIIDFVQDSGEQWCDLIVVEHKVVGGNLLIDFAGSFPLLDLLKD